MPSIGECPAPCPGAILGEERVSGASTASNNSLLCSCTLLETANQGLNPTLFNLKASHRLFFFSSEISIFPITSGFVFFFYLYFVEILPVDVLFPCAAIRCCYTVELKKNFCLLE